MIDGGTFVVQPGFRSIKGRERVDGGRRREGGGDAVEESYKPAAIDLDKLFLLQNLRL
jgi:hypothetical protein